MKRLGWLIEMGGRAITVLLTLTVSGVAVDGIGSHISTAQAQEALPAVNTSPFEVALMGDMPYAGEELEFTDLMGQVDQSEAAFAIHVGDIKGGTTSCSDEALLARKALLEQLETPLLLLFGDNEWTDCHRFGAGAFDPLERLEFLRANFTEGALSFRRFGDRLRPSEHESTVFGLPRKCALDAPQCHVCQLEYRW